MKIGLTDAAKVLWATKQPHLLKAYEKDDYLLLLVADPQPTDRGGWVEACVTTDENYGENEKDVWLTLDDLNDGKMSSTFTFISFDM